MGDWLLVAILEKCYYTHIMKMEGFNNNQEPNKNEGSIDKEQLLAEVNELARKFVDLEDDTIISTAVESDEFKTALKETAKTNPERLSQIKEKLDSFFKRREDIALAEEELSKVSEEAQPESFDFKASRQKLLEDRGALEAGEEVASFFRHPVVSYFTNLLVPAEARKHFADTYQETVDQIKGRMKKNEEAGMTQAAIALLPMIKAMNEEKRFEIKKEFFGAQGMREALMRGADSAIEKEVDRHGEEYTREVFGNDVFDMGESDDKSYTESTEKPQSFENVEKTIDERALSWLRQEIGATVQLNETFYKDQSEVEKLAQFKNLIYQAVNDQGIDLDTAKDVAEQCIADLAIESNFTHAQTILAYKAISTIRNSDGKL